MNQTRWERKKTARKLKQASENSAIDTGCSSQPNGRRKRLCSHTRNLNNIPNRRHSICRKDSRNKGLAHRFKSRKKIWRRSVGFRVLAEFQGNFDETRSPLRLIHAFHIVQAEAKVTRVSGLRKRPARNGDRGQLCGRQRRER